MTWENAEICKSVVQTSRPPVCYTKDGDHCYGSKDVWDGDYKLKRSGNVPPLRNNKSSGLKRMQKLFH